MTQATRVHSTPPTNTPEITSTRRHLLTAAAGVAVAAALPIAAATPTGAMAVARAVDPIFTAIEKHKAAGIVWDEAVDVRADFNDMDMTDEQREQLDKLVEAVDEAWEAVDQAGLDLITTGPTTPAGIITAVRYIQVQMRDDGTYMPQDIEFEYSEGCGGDSLAAMGWINAFLDTIAAASTKLEQAGKAVRA
jgi:hypothetical protein